MKSFLLALLAVLFMATTVVAGEYHTVNASVTTGSGAIQATLVPGEFTIPAGKTAVNLKCHRDNPSSNWSSDALCSVYSVTEGRDMKDGNGNPVTQLPPGVYRFAVGGQPGAYGTFSYELTP